MQVEYKTSKGVILFVKVPDDASDLVYPKVGMIDLYFLQQNQTGLDEEEYISIPLPDLGFEFIGLSNEITEEQAKIMVDESKGWFLKYKNYSNNNFLFFLSLDSFKSIMQYLELHEVNPYGLVEPNLNQYDLSNASQDYADGLEIEIIMNKKQWQKAQERTGKFAVLFKNI